MTNTLIQLFAKPPVAGKVKTRLMADVGKQSALAIYQHCLAHNLALINHSPFEHEVWLTEPSQHELFSQQPVRYQQGRTLGDRMLHAMQTGLKLYERVLLMGSDCLDVNLEILQQVNTKLDDHELVIIPAHDGGYVLIAARLSIHAQLFMDIDWSTPLVLKQTLLRTMHLHLNSCLLNPLRDIDHVGDLQHYEELKPYY